jgi:hypothetical protein
MPLARDDWFTRQEAAAYARCSETTIDRARKNGQLPSVGGPRGHRFPLIHLDDLDDWILRGRPTAEPFAF